MTPWRIEINQGHPYPPGNDILVEQGSPIEIRSISKEESITLVLAARINPANGESLLMVQQGGQRSSFLQAVSTDLYTKEQSPVKDSSYRNFWGVEQVIYEED